MSVINSFISYINFKGENKIVFGSDVLVNNKVVAKYSYDNKNLSTKNSINIPISDLNKNKLNAIYINKSDGNVWFIYYDIALKYYLPSKNISKRDEGFSIDRGFYALNDTNFENKVSVAKVGDVLKGRIEIVVSDDRNYINVDSYIPAGFELSNFALSTENQNNYIDETNKVVVNSDIQDLNPDHFELKDDKGSYLNNL